MYIHTVWPFLLLRCHFACVFGVSVHSFDRFRFSWWSRDQLVESMTSRLARFSIHVGNLLTGFLWDLYDLYRIYIGYTVEDYKPLLYYYSATYNKKQCSSGVDIRMAFFERYNQLITHPIVFPWILVAHPYLPIFSLYFLSLSSSDGSSLQTHP